MKYRELGKTGEKVSVLGFGCMRLPVIGDDAACIDEKQAAEMLYTAIEGGVNYVDTAYMYHKGMSEVFVGKALQGDWRKKVYLATKLPSWLIHTREDMDKYFDDQLKRLQTEYIDFYLVHNLNRVYWPKLQELGVWDFLQQAKKEGRIRYIGFSFHDEFPLFQEIVDAHPWDFCQIQYNYVDENFQAGKAGLKYATEWNLGTIIMEPLRGGRLAGVQSTDIQAVWSQASKERSAAEWGFSYLWDQPEVHLVLSGMSNLEQVRENLAAANQAEPGMLTTEEKERVRQVKEIYESRIQAPCTRCGYCMPCPAQVAIPACLTCYNDAFLFQDEKSARHQYNLQVKEENRASRCVQCGACVKACPQAIPIPEVLTRVAEIFEKKQA